MLIRRKSVVAMLILGGFAAMASAADPPAEPEQPARPKVRLPAAEIRPAAPAFPAEFTWLNTAEPLPLDKLKGHVVILDFWTYCCINCIHILPDLHYLEKKYAGKPVVVIGVHSAKFETEQDPANIRQAINRYRIEHPVLVDKEHRVWTNYGARSWPTFVVIDSAGRVVGQASGEGNRELLDEVVGLLLDEGEKAGTLAKEPIKIQPTLEQPGPESLAFPGKVVVDGAGERLFIADSNHDRIVITDLDGKVERVIGGERGLRDGTLHEARFANPQGMAVDGQIVYVADLDNHVVRKIDLEAGKVTTIIGTGTQTRGFDRAGGGKGTEQVIASPWDLALHKGTLYIAMAGTHQLWRHNLKSTVTEAWVGSGRENITDGPAGIAALAQPSGLAILNGYVYFADSEVSAIRRASLETNEVETLIGQGLFVFGHKDGEFKSALLQHALGVAALDENTLLVADTYNSALRRLDLKAKTIATIYGGPGKDALDEPGGISIHDGVAYIADTNHHRIVRYDVKTGEATPIEIKVPVAPSR